jgi:hypothetical protein
MFLLCNCGTSADVRYESGHFLLSRKKLAHYNPHSSESIEQFTVPSFRIVLDCSYWMIDDKEYFQNSNLYPEKSDYSFF